LKNRYAVGIDIGGTYIKLALVDINGRISRRSKLSTSNYRTREELIEAVASEVKAIRAEASLPRGALLGAGIGVPGLVDFKRGMVYNLTNLSGWRNTPLKKMLGAKLGLPVMVDNDVNLMALGEYRFGAGKGAKNIICLTLGTGVGGGIIIDGALYRGSTFSAGEIGHMPLKEDGLSCNCGGRGCLECYVGNGYLVEEIKAEIRAGVRTMITKLTGKNVSAITPETITQAALKGDKFSIDFWNKVGRRLGITLTGVINLLNPERIIIGGGIADAGQLLFGPIRRTVNERALPIPRRAVKIVKAKLGNDAGVIGAASLFFTGEVID